MFRISFVGAGHLAWHLAPALESVGHEIVEVYSRRRSNATALCKRLYKAEAKTKPCFSDSRAEVFIASLADDAYASVLPELQLPEGAILLHTSGTLSLQELSPYASHFGVFYPLQTFSKDKTPALREVPFLLEASSARLLQTLVEFASGISRQIYSVNSAERLAIHLAAVMACNFSNHLWAIADVVLKKNGLRLELLEPLLTETLTKALQIGPYKAQTGPARRGDTSVVEKHMELLPQFQQPQWAEIYRFMSRSIEQMYQKPE